MNVELHRFKLPTKIFPSLQEHRMTGSIVLFTSISTGVIIHTADKHDIGVLKHDWDMSLFRPFNGFITIIEVNNNE